MEKALLSSDKSKRQLFIKYAMQDAIILPQLLNRFRYSLEKICREDLNFPEEKT